MKLAKEDEKTIGNVLKNTRENFLFIKPRLIEVMIAFLLQHSVPLANETYSLKRGGEKKPKQGLEYITKREAYLSFLHSMDTGEDEQFEKLLDGLLNEEEKEKLKNYRKERRILSPNERMFEGNVPSQPASQAKAKKDVFSRKLLAYSTFANFMTKKEFKMFGLRKGATDVCPKCANLVRDIAKYHQIIQQLNGRDPSEEIKKQLDVILNNIHLGNFFSVLFSKLKKYRFFFQKKKDLSTEKKQILQERSIMNIARTLQLMVVLFLLILLKKLSGKSSINNRMNFTIQLHICCLE